MKAKRKFQHNYTLPAISLHLEHKPQAGFKNLPPLNSLRV